MWESAVEEALRTVGAYSWRIVGAIIILVVGLWLAKLVRSYVKRVLIKRKLEPTVVYFADSILWVLLYGFVIIAAIHKLGVETTSLAAMVGATGLAIGLALRAQMSNVASGLLSSFSARSASEIILKVAVPPAQSRRSNGCPLRSARPKT